jgi:hypothetical protein
MPPLQWRRFVVALLTTVASLAILWGSSPPLYLTNDDVTLRLSVEGGLVPGEPPGGFAVMTHAVLGWTIAWLRAAVDVPLWDLVVSSTLIWAVAILAALAWPMLGTGWLARATVAGVFVAAAAPIFSAAQFTFGATLAGGAAVAMALAETVAPTRIRVGVIVMAGLLLFLGMLVRPMAAAAGAVATGILLVPAVASRAAMGRIGALMATPIALYAVLQIVDTWLYGLNGPADRYHRYNWMLARLFEWGGELRGVDIDAMRAAARWTENDWAMLAGWLGVDPELHGFDRVKSAYDARAAQVGVVDQLTAIGTRLASAAASRLERLLAESALPAAAVAAAAAGYAQRSGGGAIALTAGLFVALCFGIEALFKELPFRLLAPLQVCSVLALLASISRFRRLPSAVAGVFVLSVVLAIAADRSAATWRALRAGQAQAAEIDSQVRALARLNPSLVVLHADAFPSEVWWRPFRPLRHTPATIRLGDNNQNPLLQRFLTATGRQPLLRAMCEDTSILLVSVPGRIAPVTTYMREHFKTAVTWREAYRGSFTAWRCERASVSHAIDTNVIDALSRRIQ